MTKRITDLEGRLDAALKRADKSEPIAVARLMGAIVGKARRQHDEAKAQFDTDYFRRFCATYPAEWRRDFDAAFKDGYQEEAKPRGPIAY